MKQNSNRALLTSALSIGLSLLASQAFASTITLTFGNEANQALIENYFNGGTDSQGKSGPNDGIAFSANAESLKAGFSGTGGQGTGKFENLPSGAPGILLFATPGTGVTNAMNDVAGFQSLSFDYSILTNSASFAGGTVSLFSGLNGTGSLLGTVTLSAAGTTVPCTGNLVNGVSKDEFCSWQNTSVTASGGIAESAVFGGKAALDTEFDSVALTAPVPVPAALLLMISGVGGLAGFARRRRA